MKRSASSVLMSIIHRAETTFMRPIRLPTERSIPPEMTTTAWAIAAKQSGRAPIARVWKSKPNDPLDTVRQ